MRYKIETTFTKEEMEMIESYLPRCDRSKASFLKHAVFALLRQNKSKIDPKYHKLLYGATEGLPQARRGEIKGGQTEK